MDQKLEEKQLELELSYSAVQKIQQNTSSVRNLWSVSENKAQGMIICYI